MQLASSNSPSAAAVTIVLFLLIPAAESLEERDLQQQ